MSAAGTAAAQASIRSGGLHRYGRLARRGLVATVAAMLATTLTGAFARALGVDFEVAGGEAIPVAGIGVVTGLFSVVGIAIAAALLRWSPRPPEHFVRTAVSLTLFSLVPPFLAGANAATTATLVGLHVVAAAVMIPVLARSLRA